MYIHLYAKNPTEEKTVVTHWIHVADPNGKQEMTPDVVQPESSSEGFNWDCSINPSLKEHSGSVCTTDYPFNCNALIGSGHVWWRSLLSAHVSWQTRETRMTQRCQSGFCCDARPGSSCNSKETQLTNAAYLHHQRRRSWNCNVQVLAGHPHSKSQFLFSFLPDIDNKTLKSTFKKHPVPETAEIPKSSMYFYSPFRCICVRCLIRY